MSDDLPKTSVAETLAERIVALKPEALPGVTARKCEDLLIDVVGLCVTARNEDYVASSLQGCDDDVPCTGIGNKRRLPAQGGGRAGGARGLRAAQSGWPHGADRDCRRHRGAVPPQRRGPEGRAQIGLPS